MTRHVTVELTEAQAAILDFEAEREAKPIEAIVADLIQQRVEYDRRFRLAVEEGMAQISQGKTVSHEEVVGRARVRAQGLMSDDL